MTRSDKLRKIKAVVLDVDGVLTDGRAGFGGENEIKFFHLRDGHWMKLAIRAGLKVGCCRPRGEGEPAAGRRARTVVLL